MKFHMIRNYLLVGFRNLSRKRVYSAINILGLSFGIGFAFLVFLFVGSELSFDKFHESSDRIFRVYQEKIGGKLDDQTILSVNPIPLVPYLDSSYSEIESTTRFASASCLVIVDDKSFNQSVNFVDPSFFEIFSFPFLVGVNYSFNSGNDIVLTRNAATFYFEHADPIGKTISIKLNEAHELFTVVGIIEGYPSKSSLKFDFLVPFQRYKKLVGLENFDSYKMALVESYVKLRQDVDEKILEGKLHNPVGVDEVNTATRFKYGLQPLGDIHLNTGIPVGISSVADPVYIYILSGLAILILTIVGINFVTLTIGNSFDRAREVGIRKSLGALPSQLKYQLLIESLITSFLSAVVGIVLVAIIIPVFNSLFNAQIEFKLNVYDFSFCLALVGLVTFLAGGIPGSLLSKLKTVEALKNKLIQSRRDSMRKMLVVIQFTLAIVLILGALVMYDQLKFVSRTNLGFVKEGLISVSLNNPTSSEEAYQMTDWYKTEAVKNSSVIGVTASMNDFREPWTSLRFVQDGGEAIDLFFNQVDRDYVNTMGLTLVAGRDFSGETSPATSTNILVNESLVSQFGWEDPIGQQIPGSNFSNSHSIIGVVKDFHFSSLHSEIKPLILATNFNAIASGVTGLSTYKWPPMFNELLLRVNAKNEGDMIRTLGAIWKAAQQESPFTATYIDQTLKSLYANEMRWQSIVNYAALFAVMLSVLGLIGLVRLRLEKRTKELGIRKVLGSSENGLILLVTRDFIYLLLIAVIVAVPITFFGADRWLQHFTYHTSLDLAVFALASASIVLFVWAIVGIQVKLTARTDLTTALRNE